MAVCANRPELVWAEEAAWGVFGDLPDVNYLWFRGRWVCWGCVTSARRGDPQQALLESISLL